MFFSSKSDRHNVYFEGDLSFISLNMQVGATVYTIVRVC